MEHRAAAAVHDQSGVPERRVHDRRLLVDERLPAAAATVFLAEQPLARARQRDRQIWRRHEERVAHNEFTLRSSVHNPLAYDPAITYTPWNDNDKPKAAQGTRPNRSENFPDADIGGTGAVAVMTRTTERDMRFRGFANGNQTSPRLWPTTVARQRRRQRHVRHWCCRQRQVGLERDESSLGAADRRSGGPRDLSAAAGRRPAGGRYLHQPAARSAM